MNLSETVFVTKAWTRSPGEEPNRYTIRWFTPVSEADLCGHATLATARLVFDQLDQHGTDKILFETKHCGKLEAMIDRKREIITIDFPLYVLRAVDEDRNPWTREIIKNTLGPNSDVSLVEDIQYCEQLEYLVIRLKENGEETVTKLLPNSSQLLQIKTSLDLKLVIVTQKADPSTGVHFYSRVFAPWYGVEEDPVCGSGHVVLAPYWKNIYEINGCHYEELIGLQLSSRTGIVICKVEGNRVFLSGKTRRFLVGEIDV